MNDERDSNGALSPQQQRELLKRLLRERVQEPEQAAASCAQRRLWLVNRLEEPNPSYNIPCYVRLRGSLDVHTLERSLGEVVRRHATLRTTFQEVDGEPVQVITPSLAVPLPVVDLTHTPSSDLQSRLKQLITEEAEGLFDLGQGPLIRAKLLRISICEHVLVVVMHHIISDGWSIGVLVRELFRIYEAFRESRDSPLPQLPIQYWSYAARESRWLKGAEFRKQLAYWTERLAGLPLLELPTDRRRPVVKGYRGATRSFVLDPSLSRELKQLSEREGVTLYMTLSAAFAALLHRYAGQEDVVFGSPIANRNRAEIEGLIGFFVNMLVMRIDVSGNPSFRELLSRISELTLGAYANQDLPFEQLVDKLRPRRDPSRNPLYQVGFALHNEALAPPAVAGLKVDQPVIPSCDASEFDIAIATTRFDLELHLWEGPGGIRGTWAFDVDLFEADTIERMSRHLVGMLSRIVENPDRRVSELDLLTTEEREDLLYEWGRKYVPYPRDATIHALFECQSAVSSDAIAVVYGDRKLSYAELNARANQLARHLARMGVRPGALIGLCMERSAKMIVALLGILKAGCAYVPLDPEYPAPRLKFMLEETGAPVLLTQATLKQRLPEYGGRVLFLDQEWEAVQREDDTYRDPLGAPPDLAYVMYTSGSTGQPKGVAVPHRAVVRLVRNTDYVQLEASDRVVQGSSASFDAATFEIWGALLNGACLVGISREQTLVPGQYAAFLREQKISVMFITTALFNQLAREVPDAFRGMRAVLFGGEAVDVDCVRRVIGARGRPQRLLHVYGPTESTAFASWYEVEAIGDEDVTVPIGRPIANTELFVLDDRMQPAPVGVQGELYIGGDGLAQGYWRCPELTAEKFVANPYSDDPQARLYRTGDLVRWCQPGVIEFVGRIDQQVKLRGFRIELGEVETRLKECMGVREAIVILREDRRGEKQLVAYVTPDTEAALSLAALKDHLQEALPGYMVPSAIVELDALPLNRNGKVDRKALPEPERERQVQVGYVAPRGDLEREIADIWRGELGLEEIGAEDNFFDLGGHSLMLVRVRGKVEKRLNRPIPIVTLFQYPTLRSLAQHLRDVENRGAEQSHQGAAHSEQLRARAHSYATESIAVIGISGRFPGARNLDEFWDNLCRGVESIRFFSKQELCEAGVDEALIQDPKYVRAKGYLEGADLFDARFFGYSPREATFIDPQQRIFLEVAWEALENAGYDAGKCRHAIGVYAGSSENTYWYSLIRRPEFHRAGVLENALASSKDFLATRVAYKMNLHGPALTLQTACSTSLVAVHQACMSLLNGECGIALAGGVSVSVPLIAGHSYEENSIASPDGHCRAFDAAAQGAVGGNGAGVVVLKRLSDAFADGDRILAIIRGSAVNNDGAVKVGYTAPSVGGQSQAIAAALAASGVDPRTISYIEAHGTGTKLGDPIELAALNQVFGGVVGRNQIAIGSLKTNIGHLDAAAGVAGLIKAILALKHRELPPSLHFERANPELHLDDGPFHVNSRLQEWKSAGAPRRAGVSSFGIGGTNAHVVLEEAPTMGASDPSRRYQLLVFSAHTAEALDRIAGNLAQFLKDRPDSDLADVAFTLQVGRKRFGRSRAIVCCDAVEAIAKLAQDGGRAVVARTREAANPGVVFMFPGQGSQYINMAKDIYESEPYFRAIVDERCEGLRAELNCDLREIMFPAEGATQASRDRLTNTQYAQPALFVIEYALARLWMGWGVRPAAMIGHSLGEYIAACLAGVMSLEDALRLVVVRARLMSECPAGRMLAVPLAPSELAPLLGEKLSLAAVNGPAMSVLSGPRPEIEQAQERLVKEGVEATLLHTSHAFHSSMMESILPTFAEEVRKTALRAPELPYVSNLTGDWITAEQATDTDYYTRHLRQTVRFSEGLEKLLARETVFLEVGPGKTLSSLAKRHPAKQAEQVFLNSMRHPEQGVADAAFLLETLGQLWVAQVEPDWVAFHAPHRRRRVALPMYPFDRQRYWIEPVGTVGAEEKLLRRSDPKDWIFVPSWRRVPGPVRATDKRTARWLCFTDPNGLGSRVADELRRVGANVICVEMGRQFEQLSDGRYVVNPLVRQDYDRLISSLNDAASLPDYIAHFWSVLSAKGLSSGDSDSDSLVVHSFFSLLYLVQALESGAATLPRGVGVVTSNAHEVDGSELICPENAMVLGPCKVVGMEYPEIRTRVIDVGCTDSAPEISRLAQMVCSDLCATWDTPVMAYRGHYRWAQTFEPLMLEPAESRMPAGLRENGVYLIIGGLGEVGLELAEYLARKARARLVIVGRSALPDKVQWPKWLAAHEAGDITSRRIRRVQRLEELGARVLIRAADVADEAQLGGIIAEVETTLGPLNGVIHTAGAAKRATPIRSLETAHCQEQFRPKLQGLRVLERLLDGKQLDFCVVNSSLASVMGVMNFASYTASHLFIDAFVHRHNHDCSLPWLAVNWDNWNADAMNAERVSQSTTAFYMNPSDATDVFGRLLTARASAQILVSTGNIQARIDQWSRRDDLPKLPTEPSKASAAHAAYPRPALANVYVEPRNATEDALAEIWSSVLGIDRIGIHDNFFELGGDSVMNIQITARTNAAGLKLTPKQVFEHPTIAELAAVVGSAETIVSEQGVVTGPLPLTPIAHWFFERNLPNPHHFNLSLLAEVKRPVEVSVLEQALERLATHHDALRLRYVREDGVWKQRIVEPGEVVRVHRFDVSEQGSRGRMREIETRSTELQAKLDLVHGPILQVAYFDFGPRRSARLLLVAHHLIVDVVSWRILLEDLQTLCAAVTAGKEPGLPRKTASFKRWATELATYAQTSDAETQHGYWLRLGSRALLPLPTDLTVGANTEGSSARIDRELSVEDTRALISDVPRALNGTINHLLLLALAQTVTRWTGQSSLCVDLEGHGREAILDGVDPSRTVGWFTTLYPALFELPEGAGLENQLEAVVAQYEAIPGRGMGFGILRYLSEKRQIREALAQLRKPEMAFLYIGQFDQSVSSDALFVPTLDPVAAQHDPDGDRPYLLEVICAIAEGQFRIWWTYSENRHHEGTIRALADGFVAALRALIARGRRADVSGTEQAALSARRISANDLAEVLRQQES